MTDVLCLKKIISQAYSPSEEDTGMWSVMLLGFFSQLPGNFVFHLVEMTTALQSPDFSTFEKTFHS